MHVLGFDLPRDGAAERVHAAGGTFLAVDITDESQLERGVRAATEASPLRLAVSCAGIGTPGRLLSRSDGLSRASIDSVIGVNLVGTILLMKLAAQQMAITEAQEGERGLIVNTASVAAFDGQAGQVAYSASKAGIAGMTLPAARDLAEYLIRVVAIAPGMFETPMLSGLPGRAVEGLKSQMVHPARVGRPAEFASLVCHAFDNPMINGEVIRIDGALRMGSGRSNAGR
jgi:NAD(P)-dependent dehydrogenase (short-subunit alcohol dehydrogenase family)